MTRQALFRSGVKWIVLVVLFLPVPLLAVECPTGFFDEGGQCLDVDECYYHLHLCDEFRLCVNTNGSYYCGDCPPGFTNSGPFGCTDKECPFACDCDSTNSFCVSCYNNYYGQNCDRPCSCKNGICNDGVNGTGQCLSCVTSYYGPDCDLTCECEGNGVCGGNENVDGHCVRCLNDGDWGMYCNESCSCDWPWVCHDGVEGTGECLLTLSSSSRSIFELISSSKAMSGQLTAILILTIFICITCLVITFFVYRIADLAKQKFRIHYFND